jgi:hypothetical protein
MSRSIKSFTETFQDDFPTLTPMDASSPAPSSSNTLLGISWQTWIVIILLLAVLGFNIFTYLAKGTTLFVDIFGPIAKFLGYGAIETTKEVVNIGAQGAKTGIDIVAETAKGAVNIVDNAVESIPTPNPTTGTSVGRQVEMSMNEPVQQQMQKGGNSLNWGQDSLSSALNDAKDQIQDIHPDDSTSSIQASMGKSGWCYVGEATGVRHCAQVGVNDVCMSGDIFPTRDVCVNPNLRA